MMRRGFWTKIYVALAAIFVVRLIAGALLPLSADEAYYWLWAQHPAAGYFDHPPVVAWLIWAGTKLFGETPFGVRVFGILLSFAASGFVWLAATALLGRRIHGAIAALLFNFTLMIGVETLAATPDAPSIFTAAVFFWALARFASSHDGRWWLVAGAAAGLGLLSKYSAFFLGAGALFWLIASPPMRRYMRSPGPWLGMALAFLLFAPNILWNADHGWHTFVFQFGRVDRGELTLSHILEFVGAQAVLASPFVLVLAVFGVAAQTRARSEKAFLAAAMIWPALAYFLIHSLHARVQGNWPCFLYPMLAVAAAQGVFAIRRDGPWQTLRVWSGRLAVPVAAVMLFAAYIQALIGVLPMGRKDPLARLLAVGMPEVTERVAALRANDEAVAVLTTDYATASWMSFYLPDRTTPVVLVGQDYRFDDLPSLPVAQAVSPQIYVCEDRHDKHRMLEAQFSAVRRIGRIDRKRKGVPIAHYIVYHVIGLRHGAGVGRVVSGVVPAAHPASATPASVPMP